MRTFKEYIEKLHRLQAIIWIAEERLVDQLHCIENLDNPRYQQYFERLEKSSTYRKAVENIVHGLQTEQITSGPYG